jgi:hypothetical protein
VCLLLLLASRAKILRRRLKKNEKKRDVSKKICERERGSARAKRTKSWWLSFRFLFSR